MQDTGVHVPNLVCAATSNSDERFHFEGTTCMEDFLDWLRKLAQDFKLTVLAHNSQGLDSYLILDALYRQYVVPDQIVNGAKILSLSINGGDIVFKDSLCLFQMPLSSFPKAFTHGTKERVLPPLFQHARPPRLCGTLTQQEVLRSPRHVGLTSARIRTMV